MKGDGEATEQSTPSEQLTIAESGGIIKASEKVELAEVTDADAEQTRNRQILMERIADGSITLTVNKTMQARHMYDTHEEGKSYFNENVTYDFLQTLINEKHGTGYIRITKSGQIKETLASNNELAIAVPLGQAQGSSTNRVIVHYSKTRTHIVPAAMLLLQNKKEAKR
ncbi:MAG: polymorphic toxin type 50 domain-containing protein [Firmicutes bacterium]|nr:polymorphic toxin type 50 domain-containing protein [Bacillota bacterium]